ncbi:hypothetical protein F53441_2661 [Fusarium austroafricanum]|uniref:Uncharacterized protein n=1 Tax=Fusarium austroafricanum TaxID=2364996 RepID=A0A8H4PBP1_9HYPO|nr:hypothetical protein F53441_2661 [Fusarium austroafricanum]
MFSTTLVLSFLAVCGIPQTAATPLDSRAAQAVHYGTCTTTHNPYQGACRLGNGDVLFCDYGSCLDSQLKPLPGSCTYDDAAGDGAQVYLKPLDATIAMRPGGFSSPSLLKTNTNCCAVIFSLLATLLATNFVNTNYPVRIPDNVALITNSNQFRDKSLMLSLAKSVGSKFNPLSSILEALFETNFAKAGYTVHIPDDAIWITSWNQFRSEAPKFGKMVVYKYGGFVIEVDEKIVLVTDAKMTKEIYDLLTKLENNDVQHQSQPQTPNKGVSEIGQVRNESHIVPPTESPLTDTNRTKPQPSMFQYNPQAQEPAEFKPNFIPREDLTTDQKEMNEILRYMNRDPYLVGRSFLGMDGVYRFFDADSNVHYAVGLRPGLIKAFLDSLPYNAEAEKFYRGVDGSKVPKEQWYTPPAIEICPPLSEKTRRIMRDIWEKNRETFDKMSEDRKNGIYPERPFYCIASDHKLE